MEIIPILPDLTGINKSKMAAIIPKVPITLLPGEITTLGLSQRLINKKTMK
jgi:hypothetical protein